MAIFTSYDGTKLWYDVMGDIQSAGQVPLVMVGGGPGMDVRYLGDLGGVGEGRTVIRLDGRAAGRSEVPVDRASCSFGEQARDVDELRRHLGLESFDLVGHSAGTLVVQRYAADFGDRVRKLVLVAPPGRAAREPDEAEVAAIRASRSAEPWYADAAAADELSRQNGSPTAELMDRIVPFFWGRWDEQTQLVDAERFEAPPVWLRAVFYTGATEPRPVSMPVLVVAGGLDGMIGTWPARLAAECHPHARLEVLATCGHWPWVEEPERFRSLVAGFLDA